MRVSWALMYFSIVTITLIVIYMFVLSGRWNGLLTGVNGLKLSNEDVDFNIPDNLQPGSSVLDFYAQRTMVAEDWGNPSKDGPDKSLPGQCTWIDGLLYCKN